VRIRHHKLHLKVWLIAASVFLIFPAFSTISHVLARPVGRRTGMCAVFRPSQDGESKNPDSNSAMGVLCRGKRFSLVRFF
jgi:hypothetical protein